MTKFEFNDEWARVINGRFPSNNASAWYSHVKKNFHLLSLEAKQFIIDNLNDFGQWLLDLAAPYSLEFALGLEYDDKNER